MQLNAWAPELYQSISIPITVTRFVEKHRLSHLGAKGRGYIGGASMEDFRFLHFDFKVEVRLQQLRQKVLSFASVSPPPDDRFSHDHGEPLEPERSAFCFYVACSDFGKERPTERTEKTRNMRDAYIQRASISNSFVSE
ncbi:hypothetical protein BDV96DRAFT_104750 [Lophiotrema nucula]|uniref:Uncharacterized protein n=1 Tax=Lophiotrema nucula TaxID=690887 RepID=A0A6A5Z4W4_9PLEO|nr:hypothetical protein BDV96DRAFT_104750 [Lophiotrema nucula]